MIGHGITRPLVFLTLLLIFAPPSTSSSTAESPSPKDKARELLEEWRPGEALALAGTYLRSAPKDPEALELAADANFNLGHYDESLKWYSEALAIEGKNAQRLAMRLLVQQTRDVVRSYKTYSSPHFQLTLDPETDEILAEYALETLELTHEAMKRDLGFSPDGKVRVEILPDSRSFNAVSTLSLRDIEVTGAVGLCKFNKIMLLSPRALMRGFRWLDSLSHEYVHYAVVFLTRNKAPIWLHEGMARYEETRWRSPERLYLNSATESLLARALRTGRFVGFKKMEPSLVNLETPEEVQQAYAEAASAIDFLMQTKGPEGLREFLTKVGVEAGTERAILSSLGMSSDEFEGELKKFLQQKELVESEGVKVRRFKVKDPSKLEDEEAVELEEIQSLIAWNRTRLGDRLLTRGMARGAEIEYQRARDLSPNSPLILNKLGKVRSQLGREEEAVESFRSALKIDPDSGVAYVNLGSLYFRQKKMDPAREALTQAVAINPFDPSVHSLLTKVYRTLGDEEKARREERVVARLTQTKGG